MPRVYLSRYNVAISTGWFAHHRVTTDQKVGTRNTRDKTSKQPMTRSRSYGISLGSGLDAGMSACEVVDRISVNGMIGSIDHVHRSVWLTRSVVTHVTHEKF